MTDRNATPDSAPRVPKRVAAVIINSLKGGVVPRIGLPYITVGRETEIRALLTDLDLIANGGASFRFLVGRYGAGKSFLLQTIRTHAMGEGFVVADADLSPERRLQGGQGQGLATYRELIRNISTKTRPEGGALNLILDRWVASTEGADDETMHRQLDPLEEMVHGFEFVRILRRYRAAKSENDDETISHVTKWLRGEYRTKTEAKQELDTSTIIGDDDWYDYIKLFARFLVSAGYKGMLVLIDELVNLYKIPNAITRQYNYEKILTMYNDTLQGKAHHLGIIMGGTPTSIEDRRRGVFSYEALRSRLTQGRGTARADREAHADPCRLLRVDAHAHRRRPGRVSQDRVRPRRGRHASDAARGHPRLHRAARHLVPEPVGEHRRAAGKRAARSGVGHHGKRRRKR